VQSNRDRPYLTAWLRRSSRELAKSGRLTETAMILAQTEGGSVNEWRRQLRQFLEGGERPSLDLLTKFDLILANTRKAKVPCPSYLELF
jgi:hypothetical protein